MNQRLNDQHISSFVCINQGDISHCSSMFHLNRKLVSNAFCYTNHGSIKNSTCIYSGASKHTPVFTSNMTNTSNCTILSQKEASSEETFQPVLTSMSEEDIPNIKNYIAISSAQELIQMAKNINSGDEEASHASYILTCDIDLHDKHFIPIGANEITPFLGTFNGNGHSIKRFVVANKSLQNVGFFGYLKNASVSNLHIDCIMKYGIYSGSIAAISENSIIKNCSATSWLWGGKYIGGLVGKNNGTICDCMFSGQMETYHFLPVLWLLVLLLCLSVSSVYAVTYVIPYIKDQQLPTEKKTIASYYPPVEIDENSKYIPEDKETMNKSGNSVSFTFLTTLQAYDGQSDVQLSFQNPGNSNHSIKIQLHITDAELTEMLGYTGRTLEEQSHLLEDENYSPDTSRVILAESGSILPGYGLDTLHLNALPDGTKLPAGVYNAIIYLSFYDVTTNEMAMVNSQSPVVLIIEN